MKKRSVFWKFLLIYCLVLLLIIAAGLAVLWKFMDSYENSRPLNTAENYVRSHDFEYWSQGAASAVGAGKFDVRNATLEDYGVTVDINRMSCVSAGREGDRCWYTVKSAGSDIARLTLSEGGSAGFGMKLWNVDACDFMAGKAASLRVVIPERAVLSVNGVTVDSSYITDEHAQLSCEPEVSFDTAPQGTEYTVTDLRGPAELTVTDGSGKRLEPLDTDGSVVQYAPAADISVKLMVPAGSTVSANGADITGQYLEEPGNILSGLAACAPGSAEFYSLENLMSHPDIKVLSSDGEELLPAIKGGGRICYMPGADKKLPENFDAFVLNFAHAYITFSTNYGGEPMENYKKLSPYLLPDTELFGRLTDTVGNLVWAKTSGVDYNSLTAQDYIPLGDSCCICTMEYDITNHAAAGIRNISAACELLIVRDGDGEWKVADMVTLSEAD